MVAILIIVLLIQGYIVFKMWKGSGQTEGQLSLMEME